MILLTQVYNCRTISKQSHDVDAMAWRNDVLVLFEIKASPLVTYPLRTALDHPYLEEGAEGPVELAQHRLIDVDFQSRDLSLFLANTGIDVPLGKPNSHDWPYKPLTDFIAKSDGLLDYLEAWAEIFQGYSVPKTQRRGRDIALGYLANGWGDEIDSNKTKAGLGRTDDIKKGTYQLLKFGAVRRQNIWRKVRRRLAECRPRLGVDVRRQACGVASADARWSFA